jgi:DNA polymerase elongation subunit (family B)
MEVFPYSWNTYEEYGCLGIRIFGLNKNNESVFILINDFRPYLYLELPYLNNVNWKESRSKIDSISTKIDEVCGKFKPIEKKFELKKKLYYAKKDEEFKDKLYPFLKCFFKCSSDLKQFSYKMRSPLNVGGFGKINMKTHESDANPVLQFMCLKNIKPSGWFKFLGHRVDKEDDKLSSCKYEYVASWKNFIPVEKNSVSSPLIMGFDIEVNSSNPNVAPQVNVYEDKIFQISCVLCRNGENEELYKKYILSLGMNKKGEQIDLIPDKVGEDVEIRMFDNEAELLMGFNEIINELNPQIICGYNIFGFDLPYIYNRSKLNAITSMFDQLSFIKGNHAKEVKIEWSSSAFKNQNFTYLDAPGRLWIDMLPIIQRDYKLENYKLKTVSDLFLGSSKDPLTVKGIFKCYRMFTPESLSVVAKYCVKDSELVVKLFEKLQIWIGLTEMSNTCNTPIFTLFTQGQQIKIFSQVYKKCMYDNIVIDKDSFIVNENDHFTGAYVFSPIPGLYDMVVSFDFSSLYPSTIIAYNIDYSTLVLDENISDEKCHIFEWEDHFNCSCPESKIVKTKKITICKKNKFRFLKEPLGVIPSLLTNLIDARKKAKKEMDKMKETLNDIKNEKEREETERMITVLDKRQLSYKVSCNSMYGGMGVKRGYLPFLPGAMCTTARGRQSIEKASKFLVENYGAKLIYGDSVSGDTPILVRYEDQTVDILRIDNIGEVWKPYEEFKSDDTESNRKEKQQTLPFVSSGNYRVMNILEVWTGNEWSKVRRVIRHKTVKKMYRILTHTGCVDVTEDHSLLDKNLNKIKPSELNIGSELYHSFPPKEDFLDVEFKDAFIEGKVYECIKCNEHKLIFEFYSCYKICKQCVYEQNHKIERKTHNKQYISETEYIRNLSRNLNEDLAYVWGMFFAEGSCGSYEYKYGTKNSWAINNQDLSVLEKCKSILEKCEPLFGWKILDTMSSSSVYKLVPQGHLQYIVKKWRMMFYDKEGYKKVPYFILNSSDSVKKQFFSGYYEGDGDKHTFNRIKQFKFDIKGKIGAHGLYTLLYSLGYNVAINTKNKKDNIYTLHTCNNFRKSETEVKKIIELSDTKDNEYVYDIETESGLFLGGIGKIILKNTDSCYISFPQFTTEKDAKDLDSFCRRVEEETSSLFPRPMKFAYEEAIYWRYLILSKKRYMALKCDIDGKVKDKIEKRGVLLSRRDNSAFSRDFYSKIIMKIFYKENFDKILTIVNNEIERLRYPLLTEDKNRFSEKSLIAKDLSISKSIGDIKDYKIKPLPEDGQLCNKCLKSPEKLCKECTRIDKCKDKKCDKCKVKKAILNFKTPSAIPLYCYKCKEDGMIDVWNKKLIKRLYELKILDEDADLEMVKIIFNDIIAKNDEEIDEHRINNQLEYQIVSEYINRCLPSQMQLAQKMRRRGTFVAAGERLAYVVVESENIKDKLFEKIEDLEYFKENIKYITIDQLYYMKLMINPIDEAIKAVYNKEDVFKKIYKYRENYEKVMMQLKNMFLPRIKFIEND